MSKVAAARALLAATAGVCALAVARPAGATEKTPAPPATTEGRLATRDGKRVVDVPLEHTEVTIHATGHLADVEVEQTFKNPYDRKIEAVYLFPLPTGAAVDQLEIQIGDRVVKGEIARREEAKAIYKKARQAGFVAALLTQERPNLFTQQVANLEPGARVIVRIRYLEPLRYDAGGYELVFPMVAGPRFVPRTSHTADADAVQPAVLPADTRSSADIAVTVDIDAGVPLRGVSSTSHQIVQTPGAATSQAHVTLAAGDTIPNKDFVLRYQVAGDAPALAVLAHRTGDTGAFFLTVQPPADAAPVEVTPRELVFVLDTSSSMRGEPLAKARALVHQILTTLGPDDTFQLVRFADAASALGDRPIANKPKNLEYALAWLDALEAGGGTAMTEGIAAALDFPHDPARLRLTVFLTDGYVGNEDEILATVHARLGASRLYSFGVGSAVNRYLLEEMASFGRGAVQVVRPDEDTAAAVATFHARIARPVLTDIAIDWGGLAVADVTPAAVPDLFVGQPLVLAGHYSRPGAATVVVRGKAGGRDVRFEVAVDLPEHADRPAIATVWARARIAELTRAEIRGATEATRVEITAIALEHHLMSRYTAFVAVDRSRTTAGGAGKRVAVPVSVPEGLHSTGDGGGGGAGMGFGVAGGELGGIASGVVLSSPAMVSGYDDVGHADVARVVAAPVEVRGAVLRDDAPAPGLDRATAEKVIKSHGPALHRLFVARLAGNPKLTGRYLLRLMIDASGQVISTEITQRPAVDGVEDFVDALRSEAATWQFPASGGELEINYPFVFEVAP